MPPSLALAGVSKRFVIHHQRARSFQDALINLVHRRNSSSEEFWALRDVSFAVDQGETLGIIGQNGSGKSTILKLVTHIMKPTAGTITVNGRVSALIELGAGFHPDLTGRENVFLNGSILGFSRREMQRRFDDIVAFAEMSRFIDTAVKHYSSGMYARLGFAVAISVDPDILIIDEVLSVGDESFQRKCLAKINEFKQAGKTIIFVSHSLDTVSQLCSRAVWLEQGRICATGPVDGVINEYLTSLGYGDEVAEAAAGTLAGSTQPTGLLPAPLLAARLADVAAGSRLLAPAADRPDPVIVVERVDFTDSAGQSVFTLSKAQPLRVEIDCRLAEGWEKAKIGLSLFREDGLPLHWTQRRALSVIRVVAPGRGRAVVVLPDLPLAGGLYGVNVTTCDDAGGSSWRGCAGSKCHVRLECGGAEGQVLNLDERWLSPEEIDELVPAASHVP